MNERRETQSERDKDAAFDTRSLSSLAGLKEFGDGEIFLHRAASAALNEFLSSPLCSDEIIE